MKPELTLIRGEDRGWHEESCRYTDPKERENVGFLGPVCRCGGGLTYMDLVIGAHRIFHKR